MERPRAGWLVTVGYGLLVGGLWHANVELTGDHLFGSREYWIPYVLTVLGAVAAEQGVGRLRGAALLLAVAVLPGIMAGAAQMKEFRPLAAAVVMVASIALTRCLVDMFASHRSDGFRRVAAALLMPFAFLGTLVLVTGDHPRSREDLSPLRTLPLLGLATIPPVRRKAA